MSSDNDLKEQRKCSFCGKLQSQVKKIISGPNVCICDECIALCNEIIEEEQQSQTEESPRVNQDLPKPKEIYEKLNEYVVGQDEAKKTLAVAVYNHYKRISQPKSDDDVELAKSNILMIGPTGSGKTLLAQTLAKLLKVPFAIADATTLTEAGYVGEDVETILLRLIQAADYDLQRAKQGIIYLDEFDKIARKGDRSSVTRDVSGEGVQQALLKILEGTMASVPPQGSKKLAHQDYLQIDTTNILFICGGAFDGLETIIENRLGKKALGFGADIVSKQEKKNIGETLKNVAPEDLLKCGLLPELVGRLPIIVTLDALEESSLLKILTEPKNALIKQYQKLLALDGVDLSFDDEALKLIAKRALQYKTGARGLRSIIEKMMRDVMFTIPSMQNVSKCFVTKEVILNQQDPILTIDQTKRKIKKTARI